MDIILKNGTIVNAGSTLKADVGIEGSTIKQIGHDLGEAGRVVDCTGKYLFPAASTFIPIATSPCSACRRRTTSIRRRSRLPWAV